MSNGSASSASATPPTPPWQQNQLLKGALVALNPKSPQSKVTVPFQYNPLTLTRTLEPRFYRTGGEENDRLIAPPNQNLDIDVEIEAVSRTLDGSDDTEQVGVLPHLAALELLIYPNSEEISKAETLGDQGKMQIVTPVDRRTLFIWGPKRVLPVQLTSITVTEELFNYRLSPIKAKVALKMKLITFDQANDSDYSLLLTYVQNMEKLRDGQDPAVVVAGSASQVVGATYTYDAVS